VARALLRVTVTSLMRAICAAFFASGVLLAAAGARADGLEPENGLFVGRGADPYYVAVGRALLGDNPIRLCQLLVLPSFDVERAVYIVNRGKEGTPTVVSRTLKRQLWGLMMSEARAGGSGGRFQINQDSMSRAFEKIRPEVIAHEAPLDEPTAQTLTGLCRDVLLQVRYSGHPSGGLDGVSYHAGHWIRGTFLSGQTWSPEKGTITADFVALLETLRSYADAGSDPLRAPIKADLLARAGRLAARVRAPAGH
jgi:hypothetical protein